MSAVREGTTIIEDRVGVPGIVVVPVSAMGLGAAIVGLATRDLDQGRAVQWTFVSTMA